MRPIVLLFLYILDLYWYVIIAVAIMSWLVAFDVINIRHNLVRSIWNGLNAVTEPLLRPIRNFLPSMGGVDISPIILLLLIVLIRMEIVAYVLPNVP